ncbi:LexA family transcriptional regulator [Mucilaginibacter sp. 5C4]|uniref:LexA family transcriptional regulator n=1 Tax=Mucilaginibacter sp. 5C4 TaxID=3048589 RepID=UPI002AC9954A|nr:LexA family transcriptional regulator [Mucilaginibacter sp. 5C4]MEB0299588.1 LexA family transcriptional regulator [Mucilaginibacter sp. 5C4]WPX22947.1 LexA family transcriptional regulator [Mucilaginibacter sp. 5C4]
MSIHARIKAIRLESELSQEEFAASVGLKRANYAQIELGKQNPTLETISNIVRIYHKPYELVIDGKEIAPIPASNVAPIVLKSGKKSGSFPALNMPNYITVNSDNEENTIFVTAKAAAGYLNGFEDPEYRDSLQVINLPGLNGATHRAFEIKGNSMLPTHHSGSIAIGRFVESFNDIRDRRIYILVTKEGIVLKRVLNRIADDNKLILLSDNDNKREYPNYLVSPEDVLEIWYWRASIIRESPEPGTVYTRINDLEGRLALIESLLKGK